MRQGRCSPLRLVNQRPRAKAGAGDKDPGREPVSPKGAGTRRTGWSSPPAWPEQKRHHPHLPRAIVCSRPSFVPQPQVSVLLLSARSVPSLSRSAQPRPAASLASNPCGRCGSSPPKSGPCAPGSVCPVCGQPPKGLLRGPGTCPRGSLHTASHSGTAGPFYSTPSCPLPVFAPYLDPQLVRVHCAPPPPKDPQPFPHPRSALCGSFPAALWSPPSDPPNPPTD